MSEAQSSTQPPAGRGGGRGAHFADRKGRPAWAKIAVPTGVVAVLIIIGVVALSSHKKDTVTTGPSASTAASIATTAASTGTEVPATPATTSQISAPTTTTTTAGAATTTAPPSASMLLAPSGKPYEPGDYCRRDERGKTTTAGNGTTITCEVVNGLDQWVKA
ncbi:MAG: hypothetical protein M3Y36_01590 [Actinomycetota bacterium]|nr:hypothetical protein [Actinomycetota bacterium]